MRWLKILAKDKIALFLVLLFALIFRLIILSHSSYTFFSDDAIYATLAKTWIEKDWQHIFHPTWPPLFPLLSGIVYIIYPHWESALRLVSLISGVLLLIPIFILVRKTLSLTHAIFLSATISIIIPLLYPSLVALSDSLSTTLVVSALVSFFFAIKIQRTRLFILSALLLGLAYLTRSEGSLFFTLSLIYLSLYLLIQIFIFKTRRIKDISLIPLFVLVFLLTISPYLIATRVQLGQWSLSAKFSAQIKQGHIFALTNEGTTWAQEIASVKSPNYKSQYFQDGINYLSENSYYFTQRFKEKIIQWKKMLFNLFPPWSLVIVVIGILSTVHKKVFVSNFYFLFISFITIPITMFVTPIPDVRYLIWAIPLFLYFFYLGINYLINLVLAISIFSNLKHLSPVFSLLPLGLSLTFPAVLSADAIFHPVEVVANDLTNRNYKQEISKAGLWIREHTKKDDPRIMTRHEAVAFYAQGETIYLPQTSYSKMLDFAKKNSVDYIVAWSDELSKDPDLSLLLDIKIAHPGIEQVYLSVTPSGTLVIYTLSQR
ncbi:MAG: glycosyltransferase family 39 protein [bacterium]|nr:glycosyltransferase family 39 protein [bacterium]